MLTISVNWADTNPIQAVLPFIDVGCSLIASLIHLSIVVQLRGMLGDKQ